MLPYGLTRPQQIKTKPDVYRNGVSVFLPLWNFTNCLFLIPNIISKLIKLLQPSHERYFDKILYICLGCVFTCVFHTYAYIYMYTVCACTCWNIYTHMYLYICAFMLKSLPWDYFMTMRLRHLKTTRLITACFTPFLLPPLRLPARWAFKIAFMETTNRNHLLHHVICLFSVQFLCSYFVWLCFCSK